MDPLTLEQLAAVMPHQLRTRLADYLPPLQAALDEAQVNTPARVACFLAQIAHESGELRYWHELADGSAYEPPSHLSVRLGNTEPGDGPRFKGRGPIQLTGRANYRACGTALGLDLEGDPDQAATPDVGFRTACWYWTTHHLNDKADAGDFAGITRAINGGLNGEAQREQYFSRAKAALGIVSSGV